MTWFESWINGVELRDLKSTWPEFCQDLRTQFEEKDAPLHARQALDALKYTGDLQAYTAQFRSLNLKIPKMEEEDRIYAFTRNLPVDLKLHMFNTVKPKTVADAIAAATTTMATTSKLSAINTPSRSAPQTETTTAMIEAELAVLRAKVAGMDRQMFKPFPKQSATPTQRLAKLTPELRAQLSAEGRCFRCREPGHIAATCPGFRPSTAPKPSS